MYLPPEGSPFCNDRVTAVALLENKVTEILIIMDRKPMIILIGDFNARTGTLPDYSLDDTVRSLPIGDWYDVDPFHDKWLSCDTRDYI